MSHFVAYILQFQEIIVYKIPPGGGGGSIASLRSIRIYMSHDTTKHVFGSFRPGQTQTGLRSHRS